LGERTLRNKLRGGIVAEKLGFLEILLDDEKVDRLAGLALPEQNLKPLIKPFK